MKHLLNIFDVNSVTFYSVYRNVNTRARMMLTVARVQLSHEGEKLIKLFTILSLKIRHLFNSLCLFIWKKPTRHTISLTNLFVRGFVPVRRDGDAIVVYVVARARGIKGKKNSPGRTAKDPFGI
jgi:hypothetical protein